jgi:hypothetical protein
VGDKTWYERVSDLEDAVKGLQGAVSALRISFEGLEKPDRIVVYREQRKRKAVRKGPQVRRGFVKAVPLPIDAPFDHIGGDVNA